MRTGWPRFRVGPALRACGACLSLALAAATVPAFGQANAPVYVDDSLRAAEALVRARELASIGNESDAVRVLQSILDQDADRLTPSAQDPDVFVEVRSVVHSLLLNSPALLERYRELATEPARRALESGDAEDASKRYLLTSAGYDATLRLAAQRFERAQFDSAFRTLMLLESHPDRDGARLEGAARLLGEVAARIASVTDQATDGAWVEFTRASADRWSRDAGLRPGGVENSPAPSIPRSWTPFAPAPGVDLSNLLARPLWSDTMGEPLPIRVQGPRNEANRAPYPDSARWLGSAPTVVGDTVFVSDGQTVSAWNRFTLALLWRLKMDGAISGPYTARPDAGPVESAMVTVGEHRVAVVSGLRLENQVREMRHLVVMDAESGRVLWTKGPFDTGIDDAQESMFVGPALISEGTVVLRVEKDATSRRLDGLYLVGFDLETGRVLWKRSAGSSGVLTFGYRSPTVEALGTARGLTFAQARVGVVSAVETVSGRVAWARRVATPFTQRSASTDPWDFNVPIVREGRVYLLSPSRDRLLCLEAETGEVVASRAVDKFGGPNYLVVPGDLLVGVGRSTLYALPLAQFGDEGAEPVELGQFAPEIFRGRVVAMGDRLLVPLINDVVVLRADPAAPEDERIERRIRLDQPGVVLPLEGQLVVVDDTRVHTYLLWEVAERQLRQRMDAAPRDPSPAITYAELAYRSGHTEGLLEAIDRALGAIEADPLAESGPADLSRVFRSVRNMVQPEGDTAGAVLTDALREGLVQRLGRSASTPSERAAYFLTAGAVLESTGQTARAVQAYQSVLDAPDLAAAPYALGDTQVSADFEATRRLRALIAAEGRQFYEPYEADAQRQLSEARATLGADTFEMIARRYPVSRAAVSAWMEAASRAQAQGKTQLAALCLEEGLAAARLSLDANDPLVGELGGRLVGLQRRSGLLYPVLDTLMRLERDHPGVTLTELGEPIDRATLASTVRREIAVTERRAEVGPRPLRSEQLAGWAIEPPFADDSPTPVTDRVMLRSEEGEQALWRLSSEAPTGLEKSWGLATGELYLWMDGRGVYFAQQVGEGQIVDYRVICRDLETGEERWSTAPFRTVVQSGELERLVAENGPSTQKRVIWTPLDPAAEVDRPLLAVDRSTMVLVDRLGRAAAYDLASGRLLWTRGDLMPRVHDASLRGGTLLVGGSTLRVDLSVASRDPLQGETAPGVVLAIDARSGQTVYRWQHDDRVRWVRTAPEGFAVIGMDRGLVSLDLVRQRVRWHAESPKVFSTYAAWIFPGRIVVRPEAPELWQVSTVDGVVGRRPLELRGRMSEGYDRIVVQRVGDKIGVATALGLALFEPDGSLAGLDVRENDGASSVLHAGFGANFVPLLERGGDADLLGFSTHTLTMFDLETLRAVSRTALRLGQGLQASSMALLDGKILISTGAVTTIIDAPPEPEGVAPAVTP